MSTSEDPGKVVEKISVYLDSGEISGLLISAILGLISVGLLWYHFFGRKQKIRGIRNEIEKAQQNMAFRKKVAFESD